jgi:hypothetical protein
MRHTLAVTSGHAGFLQLSRGLFFNARRAAYLSLEPGEGYVGKRLYLTKIREETERERIEELRRRRIGSESHSSEDENRFLVHFRINKVRPLIGDNAT